MPSFAGEQSPPAPDEGAWPARDLEHVLTCPVCDDPDRVPLHDGLTDRVFGAAPGRWRLVRCTHCGSGYLDPRPTRESIARAYAVYYTHDGVTPAPPQVALQGPRQALANDHLRSRWGYDVSPVVPGGRFVARALPLRAATVDREIRHLPAHPGGRLLDVGCGTGAVVAQLRRLGWDAEGLDPDPAAVSVATGAGIPVTLGKLADLDDPAYHETYDAVTLSHVIEHLHDPAEDLSRIQRLLKPGGLLWIATPNLDALGHRRFGADWLGLDPPRHLVLFTGDSLAGLLRRTGFDPQRSPTPAPLARLSFMQSAAIRDGRRIDEGPRSGRRRLRGLAMIADRLAAFDARRADELVVAAART